jgi:hypothetical protein
MTYSSWFSSGLPAPYRSASAGAAIPAELGRVTRALLDVAGDIGDGYELANVLCRECVAGTSVDGGALSLLTTSPLRETLSATNPTAATVEDLEFTLGEGAGIQAAVSGRPVLVPDIHDPARTARWPMLAAAVTEQTDVRALFALPLQLGSTNLGVLHLYRVTTGQLQANELRDVITATDIAAVVLLAAHTQLDERQPGDGPPSGRCEEDRRRSEAWWDRLSSNRAVAHQATGMILTQLDVPAQDAIVRLRAHAFATHRPLADVARDVITRRLVFTHDMDQPV